MNTSIGKIYAKTQGTKPHAKAIAAAKAPTPAKGNVHSVDNPLTYSSPLNEMNNPTEAQKLAKALAESKKKEGIQALENQSNKINKNNKKVPVKKGGKDPYKKAEGKDKDLGSYVKKQKSLTKGTAEWNANQNKINKAYGVKKRYGKGDSTTVVGNSAKVVKPNNINNSDDASDAASKPSVRDQALAKLKKDNENSVKNNLVSQSRATKEEDKPKAKPKRGDKLRRKAEKQTSISERNRLQNRADRKDGRAERRASRVARRNQSITKAKAKEEIEASRSKQKSRANRSLQDKGKVKSKTYTKEEKAKVNTIKNANRFTTKKVDTSNLEAFDSKKIK